MEGSVFSNGSTFDSKEKVARQYLSQESVKIPKRETLWSTQKVNIFRTALQKSRDSAETEHLHQLYDTLIGLTREDYVEVELEVPGSAEGGESDARTIYPIEQAIAFLQGAITSIANLN